MEMVKVVCKSCKKVYRLFMNEYVTGQCPRCHSRDKCLHKYVDMHIGEVL